MNDTTTCELPPSLGGMARLLALTLAAVQRRDARHGRHWYGDAEQRTLAALTVGKQRSRPKVLLLELPRSRALGTNATQD